MLKNVFMDENFLLHGEMAIRLFHDYAKRQPIIDYHCHLSPMEIYNNRKFNDLTELWLDNDHYKWRAMRANGIEEKWITGGEGVTPYDRFLAWAKTVPQLIGNPLYHWSHLELRRHFGIGELINEANAPFIWEQVNAKLQSGKYNALDFIRRSNVETICTTDDPTDSLEFHLCMPSIEGFQTKVLPTFRPDKGLNMTHSDFLPWIKLLERASGLAITNYSEFLSAMESRVYAFHAAGCRISDHALDEVVYESAGEEEVAGIFVQVLAGSEITSLEEHKFKSFTMLFLGKLYAKLGWSMQLHMKAHRSNNSRMVRALGLDTGFDSIHDGALARPLATLLDALEQAGALPKTIVYSLNPSDYDILGTLIGSFQGHGIPGKMQLGSAWWFNDTKDGMERQLRVVANTGLLSQFIGMLTDSRSLLSYSRHEYFRRILCNMLGGWVELGEVPHDVERIGELVQRICYFNAKRYFQF